MAVSGGDTNLPRRDALNIAELWRAQQEEDHHEDLDRVHRTRVGCSRNRRNAPSRSDRHADTDPLVPYGTEPHTSHVLGYHVSNHDESNTTNGQLDTAF
jgi:hypothetical protein